ncbi:MAG TPA: tetratricopeptide repeat protein [Candidatus Eisenbacteria bacterium]|nr:tetratricopeptide repeat protein [Candidatus Eisenbacteria bacterium]
MNAADWERVQQLFEKALEVPAESRAVFLADACRGEPHLQDEVAALLAAHEQTGNAASLPPVWFEALDAPSFRFAPGERIADRYVIRRLLGVGGMGEVYEAWDEALSIEVALKALRVAVETEEAHRRLKMEGFLARSVWHPNVCRVYDLGRHDDERGSTWFLTMERLQGDPLSTRLRGRRLPLSSVRRIALQLAAALGAAHDAGVVHRDFKPGNVILVARYGEEQAVVTDFGIARSLSEPDVQGTDGALASPFGTPAYMAPEQVRGEPGDVPADIYALGVVLYEMVTGRLPFRGGSITDGNKRRLSEDPPSPRDVIADLEEPWETVILRCLHRDPERRFRHAEDVAAALAGRVEASSGIAGPAAPASLRRSALPAERNPFIGRSSELDSLDRAFSSSTRLLTLLGAAGMGKTRLAVHYGWRSQESWPGGVWFCDLREARDPNAIASAVARALGITLGRLDPVEQLTQAIAARGRCLLILDNFEHGVEHAGTTVDRWIDGASEARFLVTSRERLRLELERVEPIEPLAEVAAADLFTIRARWLMPGLELQDRDAEAVREIVRLVDRMPLAIELAAARIRVMTIAQIVEQMRDRFRLLTGGPGVRHETLEVAIDGSWELLTPWEKSAWAQCSVFEDGFTLEAAEHVVDLSEWAEAPAIVDVLQSLTDRSLLRAEVGYAAGVAGARFGMYVSLKEYSRKRLKEYRAKRTGGLPIYEAAERRHGSWYSRYGTDRAIDSLDQVGGAERRRELNRELPNLVTACRRAVNWSDGAMAAATYRAAAEVFALRGPFGTGMEIGREVLRLDDLRGADRVWTLCALSRMERLAGLKQSARAQADEALGLARETSDLRLVAFMAGWLGNLEFDDGALEAARAHYEEALALHRSEGDLGRAGHVLSSLGIVHHIKGDYEKAGSHYQSALELLRETGNRRREAQVHGFLGTLYRERCRFAEALAEHTASLEISHEVGDRSYECQTVGNLGNLHFEMGQFQEARACYDSAVLMAREMGDRRNEGLFLSNLGRLHLEQGRLEEARVCFMTALAHHRVVGTRLQEEYALRLLGQLSHREGRNDDARRELADAETILREVGHPVELCKLLCVRGELELSVGDRDAAQAAWNEAETLAKAHGWAAQGELGGMIQKLRVAIAANAAKP